MNNHNKKRRNNNGRPWDKSKKPKHNNKKSKKNSAKKDNYFSRGEGKRSHEVHPGSYAYPPYRAKFGVDLKCLEAALREIEQQEKERQDKESSQEQTAKSQASTKEGEPSETQEKKTAEQQSDTQQAPKEEQSKDKTPDKNTPTTTQTTTNTPPNPKKDRVKRKYAMLLGYLGTGRGGFQINPDIPTLQADLELALYRAKMLTPRNFGYPHKYGWSTSGRTDKGVHACAQVISAKIDVLPEQERNVAQIVDAINAQLDSSFRVLQVNRVTNNFCAHTQRDRVRYQYLIPSFVLQDVATVRGLLQEAVGGDIAKNNAERPAADPLAHEQLQQLQSKMNSYRITPEKLSLLKQALHSYVGTHSFHNYSKGIKSDEAKSNRYIISFNVEDPIVFGDNDQTEWIPTQVLGQSFLLHQIRKMICMAVDVARGATPLATLTQGLRRENVIRVAPAPAQGLFLEMSYYGGYNQRKQRSNPDLPNLEWHNEQEDPASPNAGVYQRWHAFRNGVLMPHLVEEERREGNFIKWLYQQEFINDYAKYYEMNGDGKGEGDPAVETNDDDNNKTSEEKTTPPSDAKVEEKVNS